MFNELFTVIKIPVIIYMVRVFGINIREAVSIPQLSRGPRSGLFTIDKCVLHMRICKT